MHYRRAKTIKSTTRQILHGIALHSLQSRPLWLGESAEEKAYSSFHRVVPRGMHTADWGADGKIKDLDGVGKE